MAAQNDDEILVDLLTRWFEGEAAGSPVTVQELCRDHPELTPRLERVVARQDHLVRELRDIATDPEPADGAEEADLSGTRLGPYRLHRQIGAGGMGRVYLATDEPLRRLVALKILRPEVAMDASLRLRFRREAEVTAALEHPNIVPVHATGETDGLVWIAMKFLDGTALDRIEPPLDARAVARLGAGLADALAAAHRIGVVHRDVKPANVLVVGTTPYLLDFGLAKSPGDPRLTRTGAAPGTLLYMAPEQLQGDASATDPRIDVYGLGATLYEAVSGAPAFGEAGGELLVRRILADDPPPLRLPRPDRELAFVIARAMEKDAPRRYATAAEFARDLDRFARGEAVHARRPSLCRKLFRAARRSPRVAAVVVLALIASVAAAWSLAAAASQRRRALTDGVADARQLIETAPSPLDGRRRIDDLRRLFGEAPEIVPLARAVDARIALDALLDQAISAPALQDRELVGRLASSIASLDPALAASPRAVVALRLAALGQGDAAPQLPPIDEATHAVLPRATAALRAASEGGDPLRAIAGLTLGSSAKPADEADDLTFAAVAAMLVEADPATVGSLLRAALRLVPDHYRATFLGARLLEARGDATAARIACLGLVRHVVHRPTVLAALARYALLQGDEAEALEFLSEAERSLAELGFGPRFLPVASVRLDILRRHGDQAAHGAALDAARRDFPSSPVLRLHDGYGALARGALADAAAGFAAVVNSRSDRGLLRLGRLLLLETQHTAMKLAQGNAAPTDPSLPSRHDLLGAAMKLKEEAECAHDRASLGSALVLAAQLLAEDDPDEERWNRASELLAEALELDPDHVAANALAARMTCFRIRALIDAAPVGNEVVSALAPLAAMGWQQARRARRSVLDARGDRPPAEGIRIAEIEAELALLARRVDLAGDAAEAALSRRPGIVGIDDATWERFERILERARKLR